jgi:hypothetical protein
MRNGDTLGLLLLQLLLLLLLLLSLLLSLGAPPKIVCRSPQNMRLQLLPPAKHNRRAAGLETCW